MHRTWSVVPNTKILLITLPLLVFGVSLGFLLGRMQSTVSVSDQAPAELRRSEALGQERAAIEQMRVMFKELVLARQREVLDEASSLIQAVFGHASLGIYKTVNSGSFSSMVIGSSYESGIPEYSRLVKRLQHSSPSIRKCVPVIVAGGLLSYPDNPSRGVTRPVVGISLDEIERILREARHIRYQKLPEELSGNREEKEDSVIELILNARTIDDTMLAAWTREIHAKTSLTGGKLLKCRIRGVYKNELDNKFPFEELAFVELDALQDIAERHSNLSNGADRRITKKCTQIWIWLSDETLLEHNRTFVKDVFQDVLDSLDDSAVETAWEQVTVKLWDEMYSGALEALKADVIRLAEIYRTSGGGRHNPKTTEPIRVPRKGTD